MGSGNCEVTRRPVTSFILPERVLFGDPGCGPADVTVGLSLDRESLGSFLSANGIGLRHYLCAAFAYALSRFTGTDSVSFFVTTDEGMEPCALRFDCSDSPVASYLRQSGAAAHDAPAETGAAGGTDGGLLISVSDDREDGLSARLRSEGGHSPEFCRTLLESFARVLREMPARERLSDVSLVGESDRRIFERINRTEKAFAHTDVLEGFARSAREHPHNVLVRFKETSYTYRQGARIVRAVANALEKRGVARGSRVAILVPRCEWCLLAALGVLTHGSAYVPIDETYPDKRMAFMLDDTQSAAVLVAGWTRPIAERVLSARGVKTEIIDLEGLDVSEEDAADYTYCPAKPKDTAFVVYTSGTTGRPKAIQITREGILNCAEWYVSSSGLGADDVYALYSAFTFDMHMVGFYPSVLCAATVDIVPREIRLDLEALNEHFRKTRATHTYLPTQLGRVYAEQHFTSPLRFLLVIGEKLGAFRAPERLGMCESYGPTETLTFVTAIKVNDRKYPNSIGRPISNTKIYVLDANRKQVPAGAIGELFVATRQISNGYLNRDEENRSAFLPNPFDGTTPGYETMYKTGDLAVILPDGTFGFLGRRDRQVKIRGNRVELAEVECAIRELDLVRDATVATVTQGGNSELVAYVVASDPGLPERTVRQKVLEHVGASKPAFMVPSFVVKLDAIPLNVNGKVDRNALPPPSRTSDDGPLVKPASFLEANVHRCVCETLGLNEDEIGMNTDLSRCGLDSLSAVSLSVACRVRCNVDCSAFDILTHPVIASFLARRATGSYRPVHVLYERPGPKKLVFVHTRNDASVTYLKLMRSFTEDFTFACVDNYNLHHIDDRVRGYREMARIYVDSLLQYQPEGPYYLGGWSLGGCIAYEMAVLLRAAGRPVETVYLLDSEHFRNTLTPEEKEEYARLYVKHFFRSKWPKRITHSFSSHLLEGYKREYYGQMLDALNYEPSPYAGRVVFFKSTAATLDVEEKMELTESEISVVSALKAKIENHFVKRARGFEAFAPDLEVIEVPFHHDNLMTDEAPAQMIARAIEKDMLELS